MPTIRSQPPRGLSAIILAAGKGTRMKSDLPKVCHPIGGRAMVCAVMDACIEAGVDHIVVVVGHRKDDVIEALQPYFATTTFGPDLEPGPRIAQVAPSAVAAHVRVDIAHQDIQDGTGHAVWQARPPFDQILLGRAPARDVFVLCGDGPLIRAQTLRRMLDRHRSGGTPGGHEASHLGLEGGNDRGGVYGVCATLATSVIADPTGYGRIVRDAAGRFERIVEHKNATEAQRAIREVNPSYYLFDTVALFDAVTQVTPNEASGEYYLTDVFQIMLAEGQRVEVIDAVPAEDVLSINTPEQLAEVDAIFRSRQGAKVVGGGPGGAGSSDSTSSAGPSRRGAGA